MYTLLNLVIKTSLASGTLYFRLKNKTLFLGKRRVVMRRGTHHNILRIEEQFGVSGWLAN